jgi:hypothetical protein
MLFAPLFVLHLAYNAKVMPGAPAVILKYKSTLEIQTLYVIMLV